LWVTSACSFGLGIEEQATDLLQLMEAAQTMLLKQRRHQPSLEMGSAFSGTPEGETTGDLFQALVMLHCRSCAKSPLAQFATPALRAGSPM